MKVSSSPKVCSKCGQTIIKSSPTENESENKPDEIKEKEVKSKYFFESFDPFVNLRKNYERIKGIMKEPEDYSVFAPPKPPPFESPSKNEAKE